MKPTRQYVTWLAALIGIAVFGTSFWRVAQNWHRDQDPGQVTLRFAHWQLEPGIRQAFDALVRDYEALHPHVRVQQITVPGRLYSQWARTQLISGTAPDLVQIGLGAVRGNFFESFLPITAEVDPPNPYNAGTPLEGVPWRNTFRDGMESSFDPNTFECFGASLFTSTTRIYCNLELLVKTTGSDQLPSTFTELQAFSRKVRDYTARTGDYIDPIAGSEWSAKLLFDDLFRNQTQRLASSLNPMMDFPVDTKEFYLSYLSDKWTLQDSTIRAAASLMQEAGHILTPGFTQIANDQAHFRFVQGRAVMLVGGSLQATSIIDQVKFPIRVFRTPLPPLDDPHYGPQMRGISAEGSLRTYGPFGITRSSRQKELALDFLRFLTSVTSSEKFTRISRNLPTIVGVAPTPMMEAFLPDQHGFPDGPSLDHSPDVKALLANTRYLLFTPKGGVDAFLEQMEHKLPAAMHSDLQRDIKNKRNSVRMVETSIAATQQLLLDDPNDEMVSRKFQSQIETQNEMEADLYYTLLNLKKTGHTKL